jgi:hypothetical protein
MPGFSFSPTMMGQTIYLSMKTSGSRIGGEVVEVNPAEIVLKNSKNGNLIRVNRDEVEAISGEDSKKRNPDPPRLHVTRCFNMATRCNGIKRIDIDPLGDKDFAECPAHNEFCQLLHKNFYEMDKPSQIKLLKGNYIGSYPIEEKTKKGK